MFYPVLTVHGALTLDCFWTEQKITCPCISIDIEKNCRIIIAGVELFFRMAQMDRLSRAHSPMMLFLFMPTG